MQAGTAAEEARPASAVGAAPDELAAKAAVVAISPATEAAAITAVTQAGGLRDRGEVLHVRPSCYGPGSAVCGVLLSFKTVMTGLWLEPGQGRCRLGQTGAVIGRAELTRRAPGARGGGLLPELAGPFRRGAGRDAGRGPRRARRSRGAGHALRSPGRGGRRGAVPGPPFLGLRRAIVLGALTRVLGPRRPARPGRPCHLEWRRPRRGLRAASTRCTRPSHNRR